jgi:hypothetical protein
MNQSVNLAVRGQPWVISPRGDLLLLGLPLAFGLAVLVLDRSLGVGDLPLGHRSLFTLAFALMTFVDTGHLLSTALRSYMDPEVRRQRRKLLYLGPPLVIAVNIAIERTLGVAYVVYLFAYFNVYHLMRQQYGWVAMSARKARESSLLQRNVDKITVYALFILPTIWAHVSLPPNERRIPVAHSQLLAQLAMGSFVACLVAYAGWTAAGWLRHRRRPNVPKLIVMASTAVAWGGLMFLSSRFWPFAAAMYHAVPYLGLVFLSARARNKERLQWSRFLRWRYAAPVFALVMLAAGYCWVQTLKVVGRLPLQESAGLSLVCIASVVPIMHYLIDSVIWRRRSFDAAAETRAPVT